MKNIHPATEHILENVTGGSASTRILQQFTVYMAAGEYDKAREYFYSRQNMLTNAEQNQLRTTFMLETGEQL